MCLYLLDTIITYLKELSMVFQSGTINFAQIPSSLSIGQSQIKDATSTGKPCTKFQEEWSRCQPQFPESEQHLLNKDVVVLDRFT